MLNFREWFYFNEGREEKALASELADSPSVVTSLSEVIPKNDKNTDKLLLLAAYYYSQVKNLAQVKTDMKDYIGYLNRDKMKLISVDLVSKKPPSPWDNYLYWTQIIHEHQGADAHKERSKFRPSDIDFQNEKPILTSPDGKIKVYESNNPEKCIILGKGQSFCISQPGSINWQSYRSNQTSTFYFVYDDTRDDDDRLGIVVIDVRPNEIVLTDKPNKTGETLDPYTGELTSDPKSYMKYLKEKGIDVSKLVNIPKSPEEKKEQEELGFAKKDFDWFIALSPDYKSKYIGRGHLLTDDQFNYLWENNINSLLTQYVKTGLLLPDYQLDKIATDSDLRKNYIHNRIIADQHVNNLTKKEYSFFSPKQKEIYYGNMNDDKKLEKASKINDFYLVKHLVEEKGIKISHNTFFYAVESGNLEIVEYFVEEKGAKISGNYVERAALFGHLDVVKYLVKKGAKIAEDSLSNSIRSGNLALVKYLVDERNLEVGDYDVTIAVGIDNLDIVKYLMDEKGVVIRDNNYSVNIAAVRGNLDIVKYLVDEKGVELNDYVVNDAAESGNLALVKYLVEEKGMKVGEYEIKTAASSHHQDVVDYLKSVKERQ
jgi:hypothetical protein